MLKITCKKVSLVSSISSVLSSSPSFTSKTLFNNCIIKPVYQQQQQQYQNYISKSNSSTPLLSTVQYNFKSYIKRMISNDNNSQHQLVNKHDISTTPISNHNGIVDKNQEDTLSVHEKKGNRSYEEAIETLFSMQSNQKTLEKWANLRIDEKNTNSDGIGIEIMNEVREYCKILEIDLEKPSVIHIAGTKGKGSTCAMVESIIRNQGFTTGLFTSPHLISPRERIKINGEMVSKEVFAENFWYCWDRLGGKEFQFMVFFRFITVLALRIFQQLKVDCTILEVGIGGRIDSTNVFPNPKVTAITALGYDHMNVLGNTLGEIASEKAGIIKKGCPIFTVDQLPEAMQVIKDTSKRVDAPLNIVPELKSYQLDDEAIGLEGEFQKQNSALAIAVCNAWLINSGLSTKENLDSIYSSNPSWKDYNLSTNNYQSSYFTPLPNGFLKGLKSVNWPGRAQTIVSKEYPTVQFYLDGAHTNESSLVCLDWWKKKCGYSRNNIDNGNDNTEYILIYNCTGGRNASSFLGPFTQSIDRGEIPAFSQVFVPHFDKTNTHIYSNGANPNNKTIEQIVAETYVGLVGSKPTIVHHSIDIPTTVANIFEYSRQVSGQGKNIKVLATGSLYIVGGVLQGVVGDLD